MAKCEKCGRNISEGENYCVSCEESKDHGVKTIVKIGATILAVVGGAIALFCGKKDK